MKRSEFLKELYKEVDNFLLDSNNENLVDFIVTKCEEMGMLPPIYKKFIAVESEYATHQSHDFVNEWEPE